MAANRDTVLTMSVIGALLIVFSMFLPIIHCESSGGWWTCTRDSVSLFDRKAFQDDAKFYEGVLSNFQPINLLAITAVALAAVVLGRGLVPAASTLLLFTLFHLYSAWVQTDEETAVDLSLGWGWIVLLLGCGLIMGAAIMYALQERQDERNARVFFANRAQAPIEPPALSNEPSPSEPAL